MSSPKDTKSTPPKNAKSQSDQAQQDSDKKPLTAQQKEGAAVKTEGGNQEKAAPLAPPPKPSQSTAETPDYFNSSHGGSNSHFSLEPNPFEQSFGNPSTETPNKFGALPSVASLTSPAPLGPGGTPSWQNSLRSGPLSPAMLSGPTGPNGYFDESFRGSFPTPNESSLRTGLTPGGGGSMFPAPSPNSQAIFNSMQSGGATPGTLEFQRSAMNAAARSKMDANSNPTSATGPNGHGINKQDYQPAQQQQPGQQDPFGNHSETDAVNSLYMLAQTGGRNANQFAAPNQSVNTNVQGAAQHQQQDTSPTHRSQKQSIGSSTGMSETADYNSNDVTPDSKPSTRTRGGKKGGNTKAAQNGRRKAEESPASAPSSKKAKNNKSPSIPDDDMDSDDGSMKDEPTEHRSGRKMTDEEKRKNFLERNRVAALKCRQRKKQWLANLQTKVEIFTAENDSLNQQVNQMREEIVNLKTLLLAHKDCAISHQQGLGGNAMAQVIGDFNNPHTNPYGMGMPSNNQMMSMQAGQGMQRS